MIGDNSNGTTRVAPDDRGHGDEAPARFRFIDTETFLAGDHKPDWLVRGVLVRGEPAVVAGPSKSLKTSLVVDLAVSMTSGRPFLGHFAVPKPIRVAILSGESGPYTLKETTLRVLAAKGMTPDQLGGRLKWEFTLPTLSDRQSVTDLADALAGLQVDVVIIDPLYLALGGIDPTNMFDMGLAFRTVSEALAKIGCTLLIVHHANKTLKVGEPMQLDQLSYAGLTQFARQVVLLSRRLPFAGDGTHDLWMSLGGSAAGSGGLWSVHVDEGTAGEDFSGRRWNVTVQTTDEVREEQTERKELAKEQDQIRKLVKDETAVLAVIDAATHPLTQTEICDKLTQVGPARVRKAIKRLVERGTVEECDVKRRRGRFGEQDSTGFRRPDRGESESGLFRVTNPDL